MRAIKKSAITKDELQEAVFSGLSREEICQQFKITTSMYRKLINRFGIQTKRKIEQENAKNISKELLVAMKSSGKSIEKICEELEISPNTYRRILKQ